jgi:hypothetical protein
VINITEEVIISGRLFVCSVFLTKDSSDLPTDFFVFTHNGILPSNNVPGFVEDKYQDISQFIQTITETPCSSRT